MSTGRFAPAGVGDLVSDWLGRTPVLIGHSHTRAIFDAAKQQGVRLKGYNFWDAPQPTVNAERTAYHPKIAKTLRRGPVFSAIGGTVHNIMALVQHPRPFDFVLPARPDLPMIRGAEVLPLGAIRSAMAAPLEEYLQMMRLVCQQATGKVFHIAPPPPLEDRERVLADVPWIFFSHLTSEVTPSALRYKCWRLHCELLEAFCAEHGVELIRAPPEAMDASGYLKPDYYLDAMHTNDSYGALVLAQIKQVL